MVKKHPKRKSPAFPEVLPALKIFLRAMWLKNTQSGSLLPFLRPYLAYRTIFKGDVVKKHPKRKSPAFPEALLSVQNYFLGGSYGLTD